MLLRHAHSTAIMDAAKAGSDALGYQKCRCCGQPGRKRNGCSCVVGKSHQCLTAAAGRIPCNILEVYKIKNKECVATDHLPQYHPTAEGKTPQSVIQAQVKMLQWRRIVPSLQRGREEPVPA